MKPVTRWLLTQLIRQTRGMLTAFEYWVKNDDGEEPSQELK